MALAFPMFTVGPFLWKKPVGFVIKERDRREEECDIVWISFESLLEYGNVILRLTRFSLLLCLFLPIPLKYHVLHETLHNFKEYIKWL